MKPNAAYTIYLSPMTAHGLSIPHRGINPMARSCYPTWMGSVFLPVPIPGELACFCSSLSCSNGLSGRTWLRAGDSCSHHWEPSELDLVHGFALSGLLRLEWFCSVPPGLGLLDSLSTLLRGSHHHPFPAQHVTSWTPFSTLSESSHDKIYWPVTVIADAVTPTRQIDSRPYRDRKNESYSFSSRRAPKLEQDQALMTFTGV